MQIILYSLLFLILFLYFIDILPRIEHLLLDVFKRLELELNISKNVSTHKRLRIINLFKSNEPLNGNCYLFATIRLHSCKFKSFTELHNVKISIWITIGKAVNAPSILFVCNVRRLKGRINRRGIAIELFDAIFDTTVLLPSLNRCIQFNEVHTSIQQEMVEKVDSRQSIKPFKRAIDALDPAMELLNSGLLDKKDAKMVNANELLKYKQFCYSLLFLFKGIPLLALALVKFCSNVILWVWLVSFKLIAKYFSMQVHNTNAFFSIVDISSDDCLYNSNEQTQISPFNYLVNANLDTTTVGQQISRQIENGTDKRNRWKSYQHFEEAIHQEIAKEQPTEVEGHGSTISKIFYEVKDLASTDLPFYIENVVSFHLSIASVAVTADVELLNIYLNVRMANGMHMNVKHFASGEIRTKRVFDSTKRYVKSGYVCENIGLEGVGLYERGLDPIYNKESEDEAPFLKLSDAVNVEVAFTFRNSDFVGNFINVLEVHATSGLVCATSLNQMTELLHLYWGTKIYISRFWNAIKGDSEVCNRILTGLEVTEEKECHDVSDEANILQKFDPNKFWTILDFDIKQFTVIASIPSVTLILSETSHPDNLYFVARNAHFVMDVGNQITVSHNRNELLHNITKLPFNLYELFAPQNHFKKMQVYKMKVLLESIEGYLKPHMKLVNGGTARDGDKTFGVGPTCPVESRRVAVIPSVELNMRMSFKPQHISRMQLDMKEAGISFSEDGIGFWLYSFAHLSKTLKILKGIANRVGTSQEGSGYASKDTGPQNAMESEYNDTLFNSNIYPSEEEYSNDRALVVVEIGRLYVTTKQHNSPFLIPGIDTVDCRLHSSDATSFNARYLVIAAQKLAVVNSTMFGGSRISLLDIHFIETNDLIDCSKELQVASSLLVHEDGHTPRDVGDAAGEVLPYYKTDFALLYYAVITVSHGSQTGIRFGSVKVLHNPANFYWVWKVAEYNYEAMLKYRMSALRQSFPLDQGSLDVFIRTSDATLQADNLLQAYTSSMRFSILRNGESMEAQFYHLMLSMESPSSQLLKNPPLVLVNKMRISNSRTLTNVDSITSGGSDVYLVNHSVDAEHTELITTDQSVELLSQCEDTIAKLIKDFAIPKEIRLYQDCIRNAPKVPSVTASIALHLSDVTAVHLTSLSSADFPIESSSVDDLQATVSPIYGNPFISLLPYWTWRSNPLDDTFKQSQSTNYGAANESMYSSLPQESFMRHQLLRLLILESPNMEEDELIDSMSEENKEVNHRKLYNGCYTPLDVDRLNEIADEDLLKFYASLMEAPLTGVKTYVPGIEQRVHQFAMNKTHYEQRITITPFWEPLYAPILKLNCDRCDVTIKSKIVESRNSQNRSSHPENTSSEYTLEGVVSDSYKTPTYHGESSHVYARVESLHGAIYPAPILRHDVPFVRTFYNGSCATQPAINLHIPSIVCIKKNEEMEAPHTMLDEVMKQIRGIIPAKVPINYRMGSSNVHVSIKNETHIQLNDTIFKSLYSMNSCIERITNSSKRHILPLMKGIFIKATKDCQTELKEPDGLFVAIYRSSYQFTVKKGVHIHQIIREIPMLFTQLLSTKLSIDCLDIEYHRIGDLKDMEESTEQTYTLPRSCYSFSLSCLDGLLAALRARHVVSNEGNAMTAAEASLFNCSSPILDIASIMSVVNVKRLVPITMCYDEQQSGCWVSKWLENPIPYHIHMQLHVNGIREDVSFALLDPNDNALRMVIPGYERQYDINTKPPLMVNLSHENTYILMGLMGAPVMVSRNRSKEKTLEPVPRIEIVITVTDVHCKFGPCRVHCKCIGYKTLVSQKMGLDTTEQFILFHQLFLASEVATAEDSECFAGKAEAASFTRTAMRPKSSAEQMMGRRIPRYYALPSQISNYMFGHFLPQEDISPRSEVVLILKIHSVEVYVSQAWEMFLQVSSPRLLCSPVTMASCEKFADLTDRSRRIILPYLQLIQVISPKSRRKLEANFSDDADSNNGMRYKSFLEYCAIRLTLQCIDPQINMHYILAKEYPIRPLETRSINKSYRTTSHQRKERDTVRCGTSAHLMHDNLSIPSSTVSLIQMDTKPSCRYSVRTATLPDLPFVYDELPSLSHLMDEYMLCQSYSELLLASLQLEKIPQGAFYNEFTLHYQKLSSVHSCNPETAAKADNEAATLGCRLECPLRFAHLTGHEIDLKSSSTDQLVIYGSDVVLRFKLNIEKERLYQMTEVMGDKEENVFGESSVARTVITLELRMHVHESFGMVASLSDAGLLWYNGEPTEKPYAASTEEETKIIASSLHGEERDDTDRAVKGELPNIFEELPDEDASADTTKGEEYIINEVRENVGSKDDVRQLKKFRWLPRGVLKRVFEVTEASCEIQGNIPFHNGMILPVVNDISMKCDSASFNRVCNVIRYLFLMRLPRHKSTVQQKNDNKEKYRKLSWPPKPPVVSHISQATPVEQERMHGNGLKKGWGAGSAVSFDGMPVSPISNSGDESSLSHDEGTQSSTITTATSNVDQTSALQKALNDLNEKGTKITTNLDASLSRLKPAFQKPFDKRFSRKKSKEKVNVDRLNDGLAPKEDASKDEISKMVKRRIKRKAVETFSALIAKVAVVDVGPHSSVYQFGTNSYISRRDNGAFHGEKPKADVRGMDRPKSTDTHDGNKTFGLNFVLENITFSLVDGSKVFCEVAGKGITGSFKFSYERKPVNSFVFDFQDLAINQIVDAKKQVSSDVVLSSQLQSTSADVAFFSFRGSFRYILVDGVFVPVIDFLYLRINPLRLNITQALIEMLYNYFLPPPPVRGDKAMSIVTSTLKRDSAISSISTEELTDATAASTHLLDDKPTTSTSTLDVPTNSISLQGKDRAQEPICFIRYMHFSSISAIVTYRGAILLQDAKVRIKSYEKRHAVTTMRRMIDHYMWRLARQATGTFLSSKLKNMISGQKQSLEDRVKTSKTISADDVHKVLYGIQKIPKIIARPQ